MPSERGNTTGAQRGAHRLKRRPAEKQRLKGRTKPWTSLVLTDLTHNHNIWEELASDIVQTLGKLTSVH